MGTPRAWTKVTPGQTTKQQQEKNHRRDSRIIRSLVVMHVSEASTCTVSGVAGELHRPCAVPTCLSQSGGLGGGDGPLGVWGVALHSTAAPRHDSARACGKGKSTPQHTPSHHNTHRYDNAFLTTHANSSAANHCPHTAVAGAFARRSPTHVPGQMSAHRRARPRPSTPPGPAPPYQCPAPDGPPCAMPAPAPAPAP